MNQVEQLFDAICLTVLLTVAALCAALAPPLTRSNAPALAAATSVTVLASRPAAPASATGASMPELFVDQTIAIKAHPQTVWQVLTSPGYSGRWVQEGWGLFLDAPAGPLLSDWKLGSEVLWTRHDGTTFVTGNVTALGPGQQLRFTVFDVNCPRPEGLSDEDGITFSITEEGDQTLLHVRQGDFGKLEGGAKFHAATEAVWQRVLPKIKQLAEEQAEASATA